MKTLALFVLMLVIAAPAAAQGEPTPTPTMTPAPLPTMTLPADMNMPALPEFPEVKEHEETPDGLQSVSGENINRYIVYMAVSGQLFYNYFLAKAYGERDYLIGPLDAILIALIIFAFIKRKLKKWTQQQSPEVQVNIKQAQAFARGYDQRYGQKWGQGFGRPGRSRWGKSFRPMSSWGKRR